MPRFSVVFQKLYESDLTWSRGSDRCAPPKSGGKELPCTASLRFRKGTRATGLRLRKYPKAGIFGNLRSKIPVDSGGTTAYFGKRSGPTLGFWATEFNFLNLFLKRNTSSGMRIGVIQGKTPLFISHGEESRETPDGNLVFLEIDNH